MFGKGRRLWQTDVSKVRVGILDDLLGDESAL